LVARLDLEKIVD